MLAFKSLGFNVLRPRILTPSNVIFALESELSEIQDVLDLLPAPELRGLAKTFHLRGSGNSSQKQQLVEGLLLLSKQRSLFSLAPGQSNTGAVILKRFVLSDEMHGECYQILYTNLLSYQILKFRLRFFVAVKGNLNSTAYKDILNISVLPTSIQQFVEGPHMSDGKMVTYF